ncbi:tRNA (N(6)-L-threonylcarbamoyladenosine(37)-C(2))-methylthiotransferase MtaB [Barnesiella sp. CU968]|jgi:threonylcarbamoyladenosine tRNA methylthiotransferase MtaB|uniref:tRNA (N(6)-L-threonylcarbamoyladenosine(37)-C(2))- methylthiotransferase MtaB n=1 Tax=Barnesiella sp. CU968 TaxID=2780099 RepID=UPI0019561F95|nr:tRNA (N(6)-L-threonylcarbamoyladenosine(37)-C(2))-methylthiotransferase MtaB [Barnesiella sp. CU968]MBJ2197727.1 tRNA (N(6)-L-threonylcarbamoyladenosine(37)-C(2))-methylthiotransferase MtaB [Muribaculaceae bacterium]MCI9029688.1 tRNA (N(6)-L-threonylcarbamoyladenosine(37)-C(2))-methylthiotransferase MtaB [Muribaculaceae bacterium]
MVEKNLKAAFHTLGCKLNFSETSAIGKVLYERGVTRAARGDSPDIIIVNTCSVTETADKKGRQLIRRLAARYPEATMVVTGCYAQLKPEEVAALEGVDIVLGSNEKLKAAEYIDKWLDSRSKQVDVTPFREIEGFIPSCERGDRTRYFLKVQDGCDYFCTYCTIPFARGKSRSGTISQLTEMARAAADEGGKEIVITGVNIGDFGKNTGETFFDLIKSLDKVEGIERYRISSIEPNLLTEEIIRWVARESRAFMPHFHIPLQAGSDLVLKKMNRHYDTSLFESRITMIKDMIPDAFIGVDVIAGARGETREEWEKGIAFIESLPITRLHVFPYSERPGTAALLLGDSVPPSERHRRVNTLTSISDRKFEAFYNEHIGSEAEVLWEHPVRGGEEMHGFTRNYIRVTAPCRPELINTLSRVRLTGHDTSDPDSLRAQIIQS